MAKAKQSAEMSAAEKFGRALIDIEAHNLKSGDYATLPADVADSLAAAGMFDLNAIEVSE